MAAGALAFCLLAAPTPVFAGASPPPAAPFAPPAPDRGLCLTSAAQARLQMTLEVVRPFAVDAALSTVGEVTYADHLVNHVTSPVSGRVRRILVQPGSEVAAGAPLAEIDSPDVGQARADVLKARAGLLATQQDLKRQQSLYAARACSERDLEMAKDAFRRAQAERARADKKWALLGGGDPARAGQVFVLRAPQAGLVLERNVRLGDEVQGQFDAGSSGDLFVLANLDTVWVMADVYESDLARLRPGAQAYILREGGDRAAAGDPVVEGHVDWIGEALDPNVRTVKVRCSYRNNDRSLRPNSFVSLLIAAPARDALTVAKEGLLHISGQTFVYVRQGKTTAGADCFVLRPVEVDDDHDGHLPRVPVFGGLREGEWTVSRNAAGLMQTMLQAQAAAQAHAGEKGGNAP